MKHVFLFFFGMMFVADLSGQCSISISSSTSTPCVNSELTAVAVTGGVMSTFTWTRNNTPYGTTNPILATQAGTYRVTVTFSSGCTAIGAISIVPSPPNVGVSSTSTCTGTNSGVATATILPGGGSSSTRTYAWSNGTTVTTSATTHSITSLPAGTYTVTVTNPSGCSTVKSVVVGTVPPPTASAGSDATTDCATPSATLSATGGVSYIWSNGATTAATTVTPTVTTTYTVTVTGTNGCTATDAVIVTVDQVSPIASAGADVTVNCATPSATITATGGVSYVWSNGATTASTNVTPLVTTTYTVTATGTNGCTASDQVVVSVNNTPPVVVVSPNPAVLNCLSSTITLTASGGVSYSWSNGATTPSITVSSIGLYSVTATGANGCTATTSVSVSEDIDPPVVDITATLDCQEATLTVSGGSSYAWSTGATTSTITVGAGSYTVTATGANGCIAEVVHAVDTVANCTPSCSVVFPNPIVLGGIINITSNFDFSNQTIQIYTIAGVLMASEVMNGLNFSFQIPNSFSPGSYIITSPCGDENLIFIVIN
jgi:large repetitive protein